MLLAGACMLTCGALQAQPVRIELKPLATVPPGPVLLGDITGIRGSDLAQMRNLVNLPMGHAPASGADVELTREQITRWVTSRLGEPAANLRWEGATVVTVRAALTAVTGGAVEQAARMALSQWLSTRASRHEVDVVLPVRDLSVRAGQVRLQARPLPAQAQVQPRQRVWVDVLVDGELARTLPVDFTVAAYQAVTAEAAMPAASGGRAAEADVTRPAVRRGQPVTLAARTGAIELKAAAQALEDGRVGDTVKVQATRAEGPVLALVVAPGLVEVRP